METLVLNIGLVPVSIIPIKRAVSLIASDKAISLADYDDKVFRSEGLIIPSPSVIKCTKSAYIPKKYTDILPFNRKNIYIRDKGRCAYCNKKVSLSEFSFDHILPRYSGGQTNWLNIIVACTRCNSAKGHKPLNKFKELIRKPYIPKLSKAAPIHIVKKLSAEIPHKTWTDYLYWSVILEE